MTVEGAARTDEQVDDCERLARYLRRRAAAGEYYFKSKFIADDLGMSPKTVGMLVGRLRESADAIRIEEWAYTGATTWRVVADAEE
jgi:hypothetical protein